MKFGRHIQRQALSEWAGHYINYKSLKKVIKAARSTREPESVQTQRDKFFSSLDAELAKVSTFYVVKQSEARARLAFLRGVKESGMSSGIASAELRQNLYEALVVFQHELNKLQNFVEINATGFRKILKKFDRHLKASTKEMYLQSHVEVAPWYNRDILAELADTASTLMGELYHLMRAAADVHDSVVEFDQFGARQLEADLQRAIQADDAAALTAILGRTGTSDNAEQRALLAHRALRASCASRATNCAALLLQQPAGCAAHRVNEITGRNAAHDAARAGSLPILAQLHACSVDVDVADMCGRRALHYAADGGFSDCVTFLLSQGVTADARDNDGDTALLCAIKGDHAATVQVFLSSLVSRTASVPSGHLLLACKRGHVAIAQQLLAHGADPNEVDADDLTALHLVCQAGDSACCRALLSAGASHAASDKDNQWTPLFFAASEGHTECARLLVAAGAQLDVLDDRGWTPFQHAVFAGHLETAALVRGSQASGAAAAAAAAAAALARPTASAMPPPPDAFDLDGIPSLALPPPILPTKVYGHRSLEEHAQVHIRLGSAGRPPISLVAERRLAAVKLHIRTAQGIVETVTLPQEDDTESFAIAVPSLDEVTLQFDLLPAFGRRLFGRAAALPSAFAGRSRGALACPIFDGYLEVIGELCFEYFVIEPYSQAGRTPPNPNAPTYWKSTVSPSSASAAGRRDAAAASLVLSSSLAQEYVVLPVQLTRDAQVVVHDARRLSVPFQLTVADLDWHEVAKLPSPEIYATLFGDRSGTRPLTLAEALALLPREMGVCIEVLFADDERTRLASAIEPNQLADTLLSVAYTAGGTRSLIFCSTSPEVCLTLNLKQANYPVFFRTFAGVEPHARVRDVRRRSLHQAVRFAKSANLLGILCEATPLVWAPTLVAAVKEAGVIVGTFGAANADPAAVQAQERAGVDATEFASRLRVRT